MPESVGQRGCGRGSEGRLNGAESRAGESFNLICEAPLDVRVPPLTPAQKVAPLKTSAALTLYLVATFGTASTLGAASAAGAGTQDVSGIWWANSYRGEIRPQDGSPLPFTPAGSEAFRKNMAGLNDGSVEDAARKFCVPDGVPRILATPYPFQVFQSPGFATIVYEQNHVFRTDRKSVV